MSGLGRMNPTIIGDAIVHHGDVRAVLATLASESVQTVVTSPPYWGLRDYGVEGQIGLEATPDEFIETMVGVFREVRRVLRHDGTCWINIGDSYASGGGTGHQGKQGLRAARTHTQRALLGKVADGEIKPKDLVGIPWMLAFALRADGWYLRQDNIWHKPNPMPESVTDRCTKAHEYIFLLSKSERYYYDNEAIKEPASENTNPRISKKRIAEVLEARAQGDNSTVGTGRDSAKVHAVDGRVKANASMENALAVPVDTRNKRSVWTVASQPFSDAHFATFPPKLIEPCILAGAAPGAMVLDPFHGAGTTGMVAVERGRQYIGIELNADYIAMSVPRIEAASAQGRLFA